MSSKFKPNSKKSAYPPWCKKPPPPPPVPPPVPPGPYLTGIGSWADHDPAAYAHMSESMVLHEIEPGKKYSGASGTGEPRLEMTVERVGATNTWTITLEIYDQWRHPEDWVWPAVVPTVLDPMQLHPPVSVVNPFTDYRSVHVYTPA